MTKKNVFNFPGMTTCLNCGSFFVRPSLLCRVCEEKILASSFAELQETPVKKLKVRSRFKWEPGESDLLSLLFKGLKGPHQKQAWDYWAQQFIRSSIALIPRQASYCFVPVPSSRFPKDHAALFAAGLARGLQAPLRQALSKLKPGEQKGLSREARARVQVASTVNFSALEEGVTLVLVDDVLTTGATAQSCYKALGCPPRFEVWVLGRRSLSCEQGLDLL